MDNIIENQVESIVQNILTDYQGGRSIDKMKLFTQPDRDVIIDIISKLIKITYPGYFRDKTYKIYDMKNHLRILMEDTMFRLNKQIALALKYSDVYENASEEVIFRESQRLTIAFFEKLPKVRALLETDLQAAFDGDPAAYSKEEVVLSYPGLQAITINRLAHELFLLEVPLIPRIMTEYAHSVTGIDIHPGATIGEYFFIDHGTGIVVGETTTIGKNVKIYQGVTLGALSTRGGQKLQGKKRHPTIGDNVTIYAGASILGGDSIIGENCVIGSNVFITTSIPAGTKVNIKNQELKYQQGQKTVKAVVDPEETWFYVI
jgi:serine O-acetyltransferase